jgi:hypothetical protein
VKISNKNFSFFSTRNQNFPHIPYVASKKVNFFAVRIRELKISGIVNNASIFIPRIFLLKFSSFQMILQEQGAHLLGAQAQIQDSWFFSSSA